MNRYQPAVSPDTSGTSPVSPALLSVRLRSTHLNGTKAGIDIHSGTLPVWLNRGGRLTLKTNLFTMEEGFFKSAIPAQDSFLLASSSLALPAEPTPGSASKMSPGDRNQRVLQQVQLTMARKTRRTLSNGNVEFLILYFMVVIDVSEEGSSQVLFRRFPQQRCTSGHSYSVWGGLD